MCLAILKRPSVCLPTYLILAKPLLPTCAVSRRFMLQACHSARIQVAVTSGLKRVPSNLNALVDSMPVQPTKSWNWRADRSLIGRKCRTSLVFKAASTRQCCQHLLRLFAQALALKSCDRIGVRPMKLARKARASQATASKQGPSCLHQFYTISTFANEFYTLSSFATCLCNVFVMAAGPGGGMRSFASLSAGGVTAWDLAKLCPPNNLFVEDSGRFLRTRCVIKRPTVGQLPHSLSFGIHACRTDSS